MENLSKFVLIFLLNIRGHFLLNIKCPEGWHGFSESLSCYRFFDSYSQTWTVANSVCEDYGASLAVIDTKDEKDWVATRLGEYAPPGGDHKTYWWLGFWFKDVEGEGSWRWLNGEKIDTSITPWDENEPSQNQDGYCGAMNTDGKLRDKKCGDASASSRFICERPLGAPPKCGDGWEHNGQSCYKKYHDDEKTEWASARQKCQEQKADLIIVDNDLENLYVYDFARDNSIDIWLGILENKTESNEFEFVWVDGTSVGEEASYEDWFSAEGEEEPTPMNGSARGSLMFEREGKWTTKKEMETLGFVCEKKTGDFCAFDLVDYANLCIDFRLDTKQDLHTWQDARAGCEVWGLQMMQISSQDKDEFINSYLVGTDLFPVDAEAKGIWLGARETTNASEVFKWTDGHTIGQDGFFDSRASNLHYNSNYQDCLYHAPCNEAEHWNCNPKSAPGKRWYNDKCDSEGLQHLYACQIKKGKEMNLTGIFHPTEYCPDGWHLFAGNCYLAGQGEQSWSLARSWCRDNNSQSDLASIHSGAENDHIYQLLHDLAGDRGWIGYSDQADDGTWVWVDGSRQYPYTHWTENEPNGGRRENCAEMWKDGSWNDQPCTDLLPFFCKVPAVLDPNGDPSLPTTPGGDPACGEYSQGWTEDPMTGMCYQVMDLRLSWAEARDECQYRGGWREGGDLAGINSLEEQTFLTTWLSTIGEVDSHWIGFSDQSQEGGYTWSDGTPVSFVNWNDGEPNNYGDNEDCGKIVVGLGGVWNDEHCGNQAKAVCEKKGYNFQPPPNPTPAPVQCEPGWLEFSSKCYFFSTTDVNSWTEAAAVCSDLSVISTLTSITSMEEFEFILGQPGFTGKSFIGGTDVAAEGNWTWLDGKPWMFDYFPDTEPNGGESENCLEMVSYAENSKPAGWWNDIHCSKDYTRGYICSYYNVLCPEDWYLWNGHCYLTADTKATFDTARQICKDVNNQAELVSIHDELEDGKLADEEKKLSYIGLTNDGSSWSWLDGSPLDYHNWDEGQPGNGLCASLKLNGLWQSQVCDAKNNFHCKVTASSFLSCPPGWDKFNGHCYLAQDELLSWKDARTECLSKGGDLASVADEGEQGELFSLLHSGPQCPDGFEVHDPTGRCYKFVAESLSWGAAFNVCAEADSFLARVNNKGVNNHVQQFVSGDMMEIWVGISDREEEGTWRYSNGAKVGNWSNWMEGAPDGGVEENCVSMKQDGKWNDNNCTIMLPFICTKPKGSEQSDRWIGLSDKASVQTFAWSDSSMVSYTHWDLGMPNKHTGDGPACTYINSLHGGWIHTSCHQTMASVCKADQEITGIPPDSYGCSSGQIAYRGSCYEVNLDYTKWNQAEADCKKKNADLVSITSEYEQAKITTLVAEAGVHFSLGMKYNKDTQSFEWINGDAFTYSHWAEFEPDLEHHESDGSGWCAYMHRTEDVGYWKVVKCSEPLSYICESPRQGHTEPPTTTTTQAPEAKCPGEEWEWIKYDGHCYKAVDAWSSGDGFGLNFDQSRDYCQTRWGGDLVSFGTAEEEQGVASQFYSSTGYHWIGFRQDSEAGYHWVDGTEGGYVNWAEGQPDSHDGKENCGYIDLAYYDAEWSDANCATTQGFICEVVAGTEEQTTAATPTKPPVIPCTDNDQTWVRMPGNDDYCYAFFDSYDSYTYMGKTWTKAEANCSSMGGHLASIHSLEENNFIMVEFESRGEDTGWVGLNRLNVAEGHEWSDKTPFEFYNWAYGEPNNALEQESCVSIIAADGYWNDEMCSNGQGFVCKKPREGEWTTEKTTHFPSGHCPQDWLEFEGRCYKFYGGGEYTGGDFVSLNWTDASLACKNNSITRMHNGDLASIHSSLQQAFLTAEAAKFADEGWTFWIGLTAQLSYERTFSWSDETDMDFDNWNGDEPNGYYGSDQCVEMYSKRDKAGKWNDEDCSMLKSYICEIKAETQYPEPAPDWPKCDYLKLAEKGFVNFRDNCYLASTEAKTFSQAEQFCQDLGSDVHLVSIDDIAEEDFAIVYSYPGDIWIGLTKANDVWSWTNGWPVTYTNWFNNDLNNETCASLHDRETKWFQANCDETSPFVCKWTNATMPTQPPPGNCPAGWEDIGGEKCYKFKLDLYLTWSDARRDCEMETGANGRHGDLISLHSEEEANLVAQKAQVGMQNFWIGLARGGDGSFSWVDGSPYNLEFWLEGEPNCYEGCGEDCVEAYYMDARWNDAYCADYKGLVCMTDKIIQTTDAPTGNPTTDSTTKHTEPGTTSVHTEPGQTTTKHTEPWESTTSSNNWPETTPTQHNDVPTTPATSPAGGLGGGSIAAIVIAVLVVGGLAGVLLVVLRNRDWDVRRLVPPRAATVFSSDHKQSAFSNISYNTGTDSIQAGDT